MIIGLIGLAGSGKTTAANFLAKELNGIQHSFASKLKDTCSSVFNIPRENFENRMAKEDLHNDKYILMSDIIKIFESYGIDANNTRLLPMAGTAYNSNRQLLQIVGTDILRAHDPEIHTKSIKIVPGQVNIVVDVRFGNEAKFLDEQGAFLLYINGKKLASNITNETHESERQVVEVTSKYATYVIDNDQVNMADFEEDLRDFAFDIAIYNNIE